MRLAVTDLTGQVVGTLLERAPRNVELIALERSQLDLALRVAVVAALRSVRCGVTVNAAAKAFDKAASEPDMTMRINGDGAGFVARVAVELGDPFLHLSTVRPMLRLGEARLEPGVVEDSRGNPTSALDIADAAIAIAGHSRADFSTDLRCLFQMGEGEASWPDFAGAILAEAERCGRLPIRVNRNITADCPTPPERPDSSRLDNSGAETVFSRVTPWRNSTKNCVSQFLS